MLFFSFAGVVAVADAAISSLGADGLVVVMTVGEVDAIVLILIGCLFDRYYLQINMLGSSILVQCSISLYVDGYQLLTATAASSVEIIIIAIIIISIQSCKAMGNFIP